MVAAFDMEYLFTAAAGASERVMLEREEARRRTASAIRELERCVKSAIAGDTLRGLANLHPVPDEPPILGARLVQPGGNTDAKVQFGRHAVVLGKDGAFLAMDVTERGVVTTKPADDDDFLAQDLDAVMHTVRVTLERHVTRADRTAANYERLTVLAETLTESLAAAR